MTTWNPEANALFLRALAIPSPSDRGAFLDGACGTDTDLRKQVESLLAADERAGSFLDRRADPGAVTRGFVPVGGDTVTDSEGRVVAGRYRLVRLLGAGGMGAVWLADQTAPVRRAVALKVIKPGMDSARVVARFEVERQALAVMDHPNIAKVLDAGTTEAGRPFFVMELVDGIAITRYCDDHRLTVRQRLELFVPVCRAVQHAHQKGVIHRDLKPSNVIVAETDGRPVPKVIDFGLAKALGRPVPNVIDFALVKALEAGAVPDLSAADTALGAIVGTLLYMAPEQAELGATDVDTRADVYALGAILYELLTGTPPLGRDRDRTPLPELLREVREVDTPTPVQRLQSLAALPSIATSRGTEPGRLTREVGGDLEWVVMKCLEKDRGLRYESANGLAADVQRFLADEPVEARPASRWYHARKFARRNRKTVAMSATIAVLLVAATAVSTWLAVRATRAEGRAVGEKTRADDEAATARAVQEFLQHDVLYQANPLSNPNPDPDLRMRTVLDRAGKRIEGRFPDRPLVEAGIRLTLAGAYRQLGELAAAREHQERAYTLYLGTRGREHPSTLHAKAFLGSDYAELGQHAKGEQLLTEAVDDCHRVLRPGHADTIDATVLLAGLATQRGQYKRAESLLTPLLQMSRDERGPESDYTTGVERKLGVLYLTWGQVERAEEVFSRLVEIQLRNPNRGPLHPVTLHVRSLLAHCYTTRRQFGKAEELYARLLKDYRTTLSPKHPDTIAVLLHLADVQMARGRLTQAEMLVEEAVETGRQGWGSQSPFTLRARYFLANTYHVGGQYSKAEPLLTGLLESYRRVWGSEHRVNIGVLQLLGRNLFKQGRYSEAEPLLYELVELCHRDRDGNDYLTQTVTAFLGWTLVRQRKYGDAERVLRACLTLTEKVVPDGFEVYGVKALLGASLSGQKSHADAEPLLVGGYEGMMARADKFPPQLHFFDEAAGWVVELYEAWDKPEKASEWRVKQAKHLREQSPPPQPAK